MRTSLLVTVVAFCGVMGGYLLGIVIAKRVPLGAEASVEWHWKRVNDYRAFVRDPQNLESSDIPGLSALTLPYDIEPSLMALERAGEIYCADVLLPTVPENLKINQHWMKALGGNPDVLEATGLPGSTALKITGDPPLYLKIWFKKTALADIQKLIVELESLASSERVEDQ